MVGTTGATPVSSAVMECLLPVLATDSDRPMTAGARQPSELPIRFRSPGLRFRSTHRRPPRPPARLALVRQRLARHRRNRGWAAEDAQNLPGPSARGRARPGIGALARV